MLIFYVDESGHHTDGERTDREQERWFVLSAVGIRDTTRRPLAEALVSLKNRHLGSSDGHGWGATELKGRNLAITRKRLAGSDLGPNEVTDDYVAIRTARQFAQLVKESGLLFSRFRPIVFSIAIDRRSLAPEESALGWAYTFLYRRIALALERLYPGEGGVLVCDRQDAHEKAFAAGELIAIRKRLDGDGKRTADYRLLLDRPLWVDPSMSTWDREIIQLADLVAFTTHEGVRHGFTSANAIDLWRFIRPTLAVRWDTGEPDREGLVIAPPPASWPATATA